MPGGSPRGRPASRFSPPPRPVFARCENGRMSGEADENPPPICSAKGCRADAMWALAWNNPKLHPPERRKVWLACEQHRDSLGGFLEVRGMLREVVPLAQWRGSGQPSADGG